jgi:ubiquinone/menaquinone biosynthesis C-methylase UbiE
VSNLGVNNFDNAEPVLRECQRVLRPTGRLLISTNLVGHMAEFYDAYRHVLTAMDLPTASLPPWKPSSTTALRSTACRSPSRWPASTP